MFVLDDGPAPSHTPHLKHVARRDHQANSLWVWLQGDQRKALIECVGSIMSILGGRKTPQNKTKPSTLDLKP